MSNDAPTEAKPAAPVTPPPIEKIKVKVDGREITMPSIDMKAAGGSLH